MNIDNFKGERLKRLNTVLAEIGSCIKFNKGAPTKIQSTYPELGTPTGGFTYSSAIVEDILECYYDYFSKDYPYMEREQKTTLMFFMELPFEEIPLFTNTGSSLGKKLVQFRLREGL